MVVFSYCSVWTIACSYDDTLSEHLFQVNP